MRIAFVISLGYLVVLFSGGGDAPSGLDAADGLFQKQQYEAALSEYDAVFREAGDRDTRERAFYRSCQSLAMLERSGEALERLRSREVPRDLPHRARFLMLKSEVLKRFASQYRRVLKGDVVEESDAEVFRLTPEQLMSERAEAYSSLWDMRQGLAAINLRDEGYFIDISAADPARYPTVLDYVILNWTRAILSGEVAYGRVGGGAPPPAKPDARLLLVEDLKGTVDLAAPPGLLAAEILEATSGLRPDLRRRPLEYSRIARLLLPLNYPHLFSLDGLAGAPDAYDAEDSKRYGAEAEVILLRWFGGFLDPEARAAAGYEAAAISHERADYVAAVELCVRISGELPGTQGAALAGVLRANIEAPAMGLTARTVMPPGKDAFTLMTRNVKRVRFRAYRMEPWDVDKAYASLRETSRYARDRREGWEWVLSGRWLHAEEGRQWLAGRVESGTESAEWSVDTGDRGDHGECVNLVSAPGLAPGLYLVAAADERGFVADNPRLAACFLNVTNLVVIASSGPTVRTLDRYYLALEQSGGAEIQDEVFHFYALEAGSGKAAPGARLVVDVYPGGQYLDETKSIDANVDGRAGVSTDVKVLWPTHNEVAVDVLASQGGSYAYLSDKCWLRYSPPNPLALFLETDRPIYQPGDTVRVKVVGVRSATYGFRCLDRKGSITLTADDPNGKEFFRRTAQLGEFGSADVSFGIPYGRLLGRYSVEATCSYGSFAGGTGKVFQVEEYKRPEFEISLEPADRLWKYGEWADVKGRASYYFGGPVPDAPISYRIVRRAYVPFGWARLGDSFRGGDAELGRGEVTTDGEGNFTISFVPSAPGEQAGTGSPRISEFSVEVEGRDSGGRTITASRRYRVGAAAVYVLLEPARGFFTEGEPVEVQSSRLTLNDTPAPGAGDYRVFLLTEAPADEADPPRGEFGAFGGSGPSLDAQLESVADGRMVAEGSVAHGADGKALIKIRPLPGGTYRLVETTSDEWGAAVSHGKVFVVAGKTDAEVPVPALSVTLAEKDEYEVGERAGFIIGSHGGSGFYHLELWAGEYLIGRRTVDGDAAVRRIEVDVTPKMKGGFTLRWFGIKDLKVCGGQIAVAVPWNDKQLQVALAPFDEELAPGRAYTWGVKLTDGSGRPVRGEALALMYDRSLEYYATGGQRWLDALYALRTAYLRLTPPAFGIRVVFPYDGTGYDSAPALPRRPDEARVAPVMLLSRSAHAQALRCRASKDVAVRAINTVEEAIATQAGVVLEQGQLHVRGGREGETAFFVDGMAITDPFVGGEPGSRERAQAVEPRSEFRDAAFFEPHVVTSRGNGRGTFTFTAPQQVTSWRVKVLAFTEDAAQGSLVRDAVTRKHLMVRADLPRFFREKDRGTVTAVVHNESDASVAGEVFIDFTQDGANINERLGLSDNRRTFSLEPHGVASFDWGIVIPDGVGDYRVRVAAVTPSLSDAEERDLPILPSRQRLIRSAFGLLSGSEASQLRIELQPDPTRISESMVLQIEPQLALSVLNTIPFLVECPYDCVEQTLNKYVPLSIVNEVYRQYPAIQRAVGRVPKRTTVVPPWDVKDTRRLTALMETPWVWHSEGRPESRPLIDLLDPQVVASQVDAGLSRLQSAQLSSGAFPWWPGGDPDPYVTLYVLEGLAEAHRYGVKVPEPMAGRALSYAVTEIPRRLDAEAGNLALVAMAAYVFSSYPADQSHQAKQGRDLALEWLEFLDANVGMMGPFSKARLALTHFNLGNLERAQALLDLAMDGAREDPIAGVYWTPEKYSWVWYSDTVERHAFILRALQAIRPEDRRIPGMVRWLLFNRQGTVWQSTKASVAAVYAILDFMKQRGALESDEIITVDWGRRTYSAVVKPDDWLAEPLTWRETGFEITPDMSTAEIGKEGAGLAFASLTWVYSTDEIPEASEPGLLTLERRFYRRVWKSGAYHLEPIESGDAVAVGDQIEVQLKINARAQFEYMHLKDPKAAGFEAETLLSGWKYDALPFYQEPRHSLTNFFLGWMPHGEYVLRYRLRPTKPGTYRVGAATLQSMYAPEMTAHSSGFVIEVVKG